METQTMHFGSILPHNDLQPAVDESAFVAPGVYIIGDVIVGPHSNLWYGVVVRGDMHYIRIGSMTNIQDGAVLHVTHDTGPTEVGNYVTVGHRAILHGCTVRDYVLIGMGSIVLDGAVVEERSMVAAGALVTPGTRVESGTLVGGVPAKPLRRLSGAEMAGFDDSADRYHRFAVDAARTLRAGGAADRQ